VVEVASGRVADNAAELAEQIRDVLLHLYDLTYLQTHPLAKRLSSTRQDGKALAASNPGKALRQAILDAMDALHPGNGAPPGSSASRPYQLLHDRYVEGLDAAEVARRLSIGKSEYHRDLRKGIAALALLLKERFGLDQASSTPLQAGERNDEAKPAPVEAPGIQMTDRVNLPVPLTSFVGREREVEEVKCHLAQRRLVTLTGAGGSGKTRLALSVAWDLASRLAPKDPEGVWMVELAALADPSLVPQSVAFAFGLVEQSERPILSTLIDYLRDRRCLLVLDNCEHLIEACAKLVDGLLRACPGLTVLATSRESVRVDGEAVYLVPPLAVPDPERLPTLDELVSFGGVRLFAERAGSARPTFQVTAQNASAVARICSRLDGLPLAIELAAARVRVLSPEQIAQRLDDRFALLTGGTRSALPRQQTLEATLDWSHDLLAEPEKALFRRLAVFSGGWSLEAAEAICADEIVQASQVLDLLTRLVDRSLVLAEALTGEVRYRLLETVREYAWGKLIGSGEEEVRRIRHRDWYLAFAERAEAELDGRDVLLWLGRLDLERDNLLAAVEYSRLEPEGAEAELRLATALRGYWLTRGYESEERERLESALARNAGGHSARRIDALLEAGLRTVFVGPLSLERARELFEEGLAIARQLGDSAMEARALHHLAGLEQDLGRLPEARAILEDALRIARRTDDQLAIVDMLEALGDVLVDQGAYSEALPPLMDGLAIARSRGAPVIAILWDLGRLATLTGDYYGARQLLEEAVANARAQGNAKAAGVGLMQLGDLARAEGDLSAARSFYRESLASELEARSTLAVAMALGRLADLTAAEGRSQQAARLFGALGAWYRSVGREVQYKPHPNHQLDLGAARAALGADAYDRAWAEGQGMTLEQAVAYALQD
jgi:predicted ATPase